MNELHDGVVSYVRKILGQSVKIKPWPGASSLPVFLQKTYTFYATEIMSHSCLIAIDEGTKEQAPTVIEKHLSQLRKTWTENIIYVRQSISAYSRTRLIEHKIPFIVPDNQLYLPDLGLDLREHMNKLRSAPEPLSPSTQALVLYVLNKRFYGPLTADRFKKILGYTPMTFSRALNELERIQPASITTKGHKRILEFKEKGRSLWNLALPYLLSPVKKEAPVHLPSALLKMAKEAGLSALSSYSMLSNPVVPVIALWEDVVSAYKLPELPFEEKGVHIVEVWKYDPGLLSDGKAVDRLSLYLSLRNNRDERVESSLDKILEDIQW